MSALDLSLYLLIAMCAISAFCVLLARNVFHAALLLIVCLISLAAIYLLMQAELLAVAQLLIYAGGVLVLIVFGIMLTIRMSGKPMLVPRENFLPGVICASVLFGLLIYSIRGLAVEIGFNEIKSGWFATARSLFIEHGGPFEITGLLLLASLIAAVTISSTFLKKSS